jgi:hypothetical protein
MNEEIEALNNAQRVNDKPIMDLKEYIDKGQDVPDMTDPEWSDYVLGQFTEDEIYKGNPTTDGLRRVAQKLLGTIIKSISHVIQAPTPANDNHATVEHSITIWWDNQPGDERVFQDVADVYAGNTDATYAIFSTATAATRAEGRSLRKALQLKRILAAEELTTVPPEDPTHINSGQITFINMMCERNDINVLKLLAQSKTKKFNKIEDVPYITAVQISKYLSDCQNGIVKTPEGIKGYDPNWRKVNES